MDLRRYGEVDAFLAAAEPFLVAREAEHNLILGVMSDLRDAPEEFTGAPYLATVLANGRVVAAAMQTPPFGVVLSEIDHPGAIALLADDLVDRDLPGALGPVEHARAFVKARIARGGPPARLALSERIFRLTEVQPPAAVPGNLRRAEASDRQVVHDWLGAFMREALEPADPAEVAGMTDRWLAGRGRALYLWEDGEVASLAGIGSPTPHGVRVAGVHATRPAWPRLRERPGRRDQSGRARRRPHLLLPVHRPGEPDLEPHLRDDRLSARPRR